jgi:hypothetical protein
VYHFISLLILCVVCYGLSIIIGCKKKVPEPYVPGATVRGMLTLSEIANGKPYAVVLDSVTIITNDFIMSHESVCQSETAVQYSFYDTSSGEYY